MEAFRPPRRTPGDLALHPEPQPQLPHASPAPNPAAEPLLALLQQALGHELPNHLVAVQGLARLLDVEAGDRLGPDGKEYVQRLGAAAQRAHELVRGLAEILRVWRVPGAVARVALGDVIRDVAGELQGKGASRAFAYELPDQGPFLQLPATALRQMVSHLLRFIVQSEIPASGAPVVAGARATPTGAEWWVTDPARVLPAVECARLLEPFAARTGGGPGLGLVPAKLLVDNCGGTMCVESAAERGTTVMIRFASERI